MQEKDPSPRGSQERKANEPHQSGDEDPDIAGIIPGPQPSPWDDDDLLDDKSDK